MALAVGDSALVKVVDVALSPGERRVRNDGPDPVKISKDPTLTASGGFAIALNGEETVWVGAGQSLYAICASGKSASLEVL